MNRLIPAAGNGLAGVGGRIRTGIRVSGGVLLSIALLTAGSDLPIAAADDPTPVVRNCSGQPEVKPASITFTCADNTIRVDKIVWSRWGIDGATGRGTKFEVICEPNCAQGRPVYSPAIITLSGAAPPDFRFTSATFQDLTTGGSYTVPR
jgi:hypothetical protein